MAPTAVPEPAKADKTKAKTANEHPVPGETKAEKSEPRTEPEKAEAKAEKTKAKAEKAAARSEVEAEKAEAKAEKVAKTEGASEGPNADHPGRHGAQGRQHASAMHALHEDLKHGKVKQEDVKEHLAQLRSSVKQRQKDHREQLGQRWGGALAKPALREELRHHARRAALLNRAILVAQTDPNVKDKQKLVERIEKLIAKEDARHDKAMQRFEAASAAAEQPEGSTKPAAATDLNAPAKGSEP